VLVDDIRLEARDEQWELSGRVTMDRIDTHDLRIWFRFPGEYSTGEVDASPFVPGLLATSMWWNENLIIDGPVSARLLGAAPVAMRRYRDFYPSLTVVPLSASPRKLAGKPTATACFFTRGVDSWYSALTNVESVSGSRPRLTHLLHVPGIDWKLTAPTHARVLAATRAAAAGIGCELVLVETNLRAFIERFQPWDVTHGGALAGIGLVLGARFSHLLIASTFPLYRVLPWGSHPTLDPLWSTEQTEIVHDAADVSRVDKQCFLVDHPHAFSNLKVCYEADTESNCGVCEKCMLTMVGLRVAGVREHLAAFAVPLQARRLATHVVSAENRGWVRELVDRLVEPEDRVYRLALEGVLVRCYVTSILTRLGGIVRSAARSPSALSVRRSSH
jgi:hypothetical protein